MWRSIVLAIATNLTLAEGALGKAFEFAPILPDNGVERLDQSVTRAQLDRDLLSAPAATVILSDVDLYDRFPYIESRAFQVVSDPAWNRLVYGAVGKGVRAFDGVGTSFGPLRGPRGLASDERGRVYVADTENGRVLVFATPREFDTMELVPLFAIEGFSRPTDVAYSDGGTPFEFGDERLYVVDAGRHSLHAYALDDGAARGVAAIGGLGSGAGRFAGPIAVAVGRDAGVNTADVYVTDAHNRRIVHLRDGRNAFAWTSEAPIDDDMPAAIETDHWGNVYVAECGRGCVEKFNPSLESVVELRDGIGTPRDFHVAFANIRDHRTGSVTRRGDGKAVLLEPWSQTSGMRLVNLGVDLTDVSVADASGLAVEFTLADRADVTVEMIGFADEPASISATLDAGRHSIPLGAGALAAAPGAQVRVAAQSAYEGGGRVVREIALSGSNGAGAGASQRLHVSPNPFVASASVAFALTNLDAPRFDVSVYDVSGRRVRTLATGETIAGRRSVVWDGRDERGEAAATGLYLFRLQSGGLEVVTKGVLLR
ncbi:MAG: FlgD immunoglobulin-like domain containing protein [bacterium]